MDSFIVITSLLVPRLWKQIVQRENEFDNKKDESICYWLCPCMIYSQKPRKPISWKNKERRKQQWKSVICTSVGFW